MLGLWSDLLPVVVYWVCLHSHSYQSFLYLALLKSWISTWCSLRQSPDSTAETSYTCKYSMSSRYLTISVSYFVSSLHVYHERTSSTRFSRRASLSISVPLWWTSSRAEDRVLHSFLLSIAQTPPFEKLCFSPKSWTCISFLKTLS